jgi:membrane protease YdiL (CAAX protease family)
MQDLKPMTVQSSLLFFGIPAILVTIQIYFVMGLFADLSLPIFWNYTLVYATIPMVLLIIVSLIFYRREGNALSWSGLKQRFRLHRMNKNDWLWALGLFLFMFITAGILSVVTSPVIASLFPPPDYWPDELNPLKSSPSTEIPTVFLGEPLIGNWWILLVVFSSLVIATLGEELWWRGYILPRQELTHDKNTWIVHGILWNLFHIFHPWNLLVLLPGTLALSYVVQKRENTWVAIIAHALANGFLVISVILMGIMG